MKTIMMKMGLAVFALLCSMSLLAEKKVVTYKVSMDCGGCAKKVEKNLPFEKGVKDLSIDMSKREVTVTFEDTKTSVEKIEEALEKLDFEVEVVKPAESVKKK